jgi:hypothetical protein
MTALFDSQEPRDPSQQSPDEYDTYVPEREFVLMPLFRRIGERLGLRRSVTEEPVHIAHAPIPTEQQVEKARVEPVVAEQAPVAPASMVAQPAEPEIAISALSVDSEAAPLESEALADPVASLIKAETPKRSIAAPVVELSRKASGALSGAAHWLAEKQEAILHRAKAPEILAEDLLRGPQKEPIPFPKTEPAPPIIEPASERDPAPSVAHDVDESFAVPALQREIAWAEHNEAAVPVAAGEQSSSVPAAPPPVATWWQHRIDWSRYFTSRRVALLGGLAMAALLMLGISLARRPAGDMLPQQTATQPPEPGGVTLSTHPAVTRTRPQPQTAAPAAPAHVRRAHAAVDDGGPEVVTHYYHQKPSPIHQATASSDGVRHYSDLN